MIAPQRALIVKKSTDPLLLVSTASEAPGVRYACGFAAPDPVLFLKNGRRQVLVVPQLEVGRARQTAQRTTVLTPEDLDLTPLQRRSLGEWAAGLLRSEGLRSVSVSPGCPVSVVRALEKHRVRVNVAEGALFPARETKRADEVECIRAAQRAAVAAMKQAVQCLREASIGPRGELRWKGGTLTSERLRFEIEKVLLEHQCHAAETIVAGGRQGADPHERGHGPLRAHEPIVLDIFPQHKKHGYWGDITRTVVKGVPREEVRRMHAAVLEAQEQALAMLKAGVSGKAVHARVQRVLEGHGFRTGQEDGVPVGFFHGTGHGVGLEIHEAPRISPAGGRLKAGHVVTVEPGLYYPALGGMRIEDTVVITRDGWQPLATLPKSLCV